MSVAIVLPQLYFLIHVVDFIQISLNDLRGLCI